LISARMREIGVGSAPLPAPSFFLVVMDTLTVVDTATAAESPAGPQARSACQRFVKLWLRLVIQGLIYRTDRII